MMQLNPRLAKHLETYEPERYKSLLAWLNAESPRNPLAQSERVEAMLQDVTNEERPAAHSPLELDDLVQVAILNEFGPQVEEKPYFRWLNYATYQRLILGS